MSNDYRKKFFRDNANKSKDGWYECVSCHKKFKEGDITIDHILPQSRGGGHNIDNLQCMCRSCNSSKKNSMDKSADDYVRNVQRIVNSDVKNSVSRKDIQELEIAIEKGKRGIASWLKK